MGDILSLVDSIQEEYVPTIPARYKKAGGLGPPDGRDDGVKVFGEFFFTSHFITIGFIIIVLVTYFTFLSLECFVYYFINREFGTY